MLALFNLGPSIITSAFIGKIQRISKRGSLFLAYSFIIFGLIGLPCAKNFPQFCLLLVIGALGRGIVFPVLMDLSIRGVPASQKGTAMGIFQSIFAVGMFLGPAVSGLFANGIGLASAFVFSGLLVIVGGVLWWMTIEKRARPEPPPIRF